MLALAVMLAGCARILPHANGNSPTPPSATTAKPAPVAAPKIVITPDVSLTAKVISVNSVGRFVVLNFPGGQLPKLQQTLFLYHAGLKTAEVKITGPQTDDNIIADLVSGEAQVGDIVRE